MSYHLERAAATGFAPLRNFHAPMSRHPYLTALALWALLLALAFSTFLWAFQEPETVKSIDLTGHTAKDSPLRLERPGPRTALFEPEDQEPHPVEHWAAVAPLGLPTAGFLNEDALPFSRAQAKLGRELFHLSALSGTTRSCATCHDPNWDFRSPKRANTPSLWNLAYLAPFNRPGGRQTLEARIRRSWTSELELGAQDPSTVAARLGADPRLQERFQQAFAAKLTPALIDRALASYLILLRSGASPFDHSRGSGPRLEARAARGFEVFQRARCSTCHPPPLFTDRYDGVTKTPSLRGDLEARAPYLSGTCETLGELLRQHGEHDLNDEEQQALLAFLRSLRGEHHSGESP